VAWGKDRGAAGPAGNRLTPLDIDALVYATGVARPAPPSQACASPDPGAKNAAGLDWARVLRGSCSR